MRGKGAGPLSVVIAILVVLGVVWLSSRGRKARVEVRKTVRERVEGPAVLPREPETILAAPRLVPPSPVPRATVPTTRAVPAPRLTISADRAASASVRGSRSSATAYMLRRRGLCSPDPHP